VKPGGLPLGDGAQVSWAVSHRKKETCAEAPRIRHGDGDTTVSGGDTLVELALRDSILILGWRTTELCGGAESHWPADKENLHKRCEEEG